MGEMRYSTFSALEKLKSTLWSAYDHARPAIIVCIWDGDQAAEAIEIFKMLEVLVSEKKADGRVELFEIDSRDLEDQGPLVMVLPAFSLHTRVLPADCPAIVDELIRENQVRLDFFPSGSAGADSPLLTERLTTEFVAPQSIKTQKEKITPTFTGTLLGAYLLATRKTAGLLRRRTADKRPPASEKEKKLDLLAQKILAKYEQIAPVIVICAWDGGCAADALTVYQSLKTAQEKYRTNVRIHIKKIDPEEFSAHGPLLMTLTGKGKSSQRAIYVSVRPYDAEPIISRTVLKGEILEGLCYRETTQEEPKTLTLEELSAMALSDPALNAYLYGKEQKSSQLAPADPMTTALFLLNPGKLSFLPPEILSRSGLNRSDWFEGDPLTEIGSQLAAEAALTDRLSEMRKAGFAEAQAGGEAAFLTVAELFKQDERQTGSSLTDDPAPLSLSDLAASAKPVVSKKNSPAIILIASPGVEPEIFDRIGNAFSAAIVSKNLLLTLYRSPLNGIPDQGVMAVLRPCGIFYCNLQPEDVSQILERTYLRGQVISSLLYRSPLSGKAILLESATPFAQAQLRVLTSDFLIDGISDVGRLSDGDGALSLRIALQAAPDQLIQTIAAAKLRERSGQGVSLADLLEHCRIVTDKSDDAAAEKMLVATTAAKNAVDRLLLERALPEIIRGLLIGAAAAGAKRGILYCGGADKALTERLHAQLAMVAGKGLIGKNILGSGVDFALDLFVGSDSNCGMEPTAILAEIAGRAPEPVSGAVPNQLRSCRLFGNQAVVCSATTWALVPSVFRLSAEVFASLGSFASGGTFLMSLEGDALTASQVVEVQPGIRLRTLIYSLAGLKENTRVKMMRNGEQGLLIPADRLSAAVDFSAAERLNPAFKSVWTVFSERQCVLQALLDDLRESAAASCDRCMTCRFGYPRLIDGLERCSEGVGSETLLESLVSVAEGMSVSAACNHCRQAVIPFLDALTTFEAEFDAHLNGSCPAGCCPKLTDFHVLGEDCNGRDDCLPACPQKTLEIN